MKNFENFSISRKLLICFLGLSFVLLVVGGGGIFGMLTMNHRDAYMYEEKTAPIDHLIAATKSLYQIRVDARGAVIHAGQPEQIGNYEQSYQSSKETFLQESALYQKSIDDSEKDAAKLFQEAADIFNNQFDPVIEKTFTLAKQGDQKAANAAGATATDKIQILFQNYDQLIASRMASLEASNRQNNTTALWTTGVLVLLVVLGAGAAIYLGIRVSKMISQPIGEVVEAADKMALGRVDIDLNNITSKDETGQLALAFGRMLSGIREQVHAAEKISQGDFTTAVTVRSEEDILGSALQKMEHALNTTLLMITGAADQVNLGADQIASASQALASGAAEHAATVEELTASIAGVAQQAEQNVTSVQKATQYVEETGTGLIAGNAHMQHLHTAMQEISEASEKISDITKVIEDIAFQTNMLALNAAVESARAGAAGKGFAVVADEVRTLAAKSAEAAKQTAALISHTVSLVEDGEKLAEETAQILENVAEKSRMVEGAMRSIENASAEQATAILQINQGLEQVSSVIQTNAATAEESSASSEELAAQAQTLQEEVRKFKLREERTTEYVASNWEPVSVQTGDRYTKY